MSAHMHAAIVLAVIVLLNALFIITGHAQEDPLPAEDLVAPAPDPAPMLAPPLAPRAVPITKSDCPETHPVKGNASSMIYHLPTGQFYTRTDPESCFLTAGDAEAAGFRASQR